MHTKTFNLCLLSVLIALHCAPALADSRAQSAPAARVDMPALKKRLQSDALRRPDQAIPVLRDALRQKSTLSLTDQLWLQWRLADDLFRARQYEEALATARRGQAEAAQIPAEQVRFGWLATLILHEQDRNKEALGEFTKIAPLLLPLSRQTDQRESRLAAANGWRIGGSVLSSMGQLPEAMDMLIRALAIFDTAGDAVFEQSDTLNRISLVHFKAGKLDDALREIAHAIDLSEQAGVTDSLSGYYLRKSHFLSGVGRVDDQFQSLVAARKLAQNEGNDYNLAVIATNLADVALQKKDYQAALRYAEEAMPLVEKSKDRESLMVCWINKGIALNRLGRPGGIALIQQAIDGFSREPGTQDIAADVQGVLAEELAFNRDFERAYAAFVEHKKRSDSVRTASNQKRIAETDARYQADKKQRQIELLEQEQRTQKRFQMLWALAGALGLLMALILFISRFYLKRAYRKVSELSLSDSLTGLRNRRYLASRINEDLAQIARQRLAHTRAHGAAAPPNADVMFMMIDMDHFKAVNDQHGHAGGDALLQQFSAILLQEVRDSDTVVRWGGEEFLIVAKQASADGMRLLAERIRARVAGFAFDLGQGVILHKTCSIGFCSYPFLAPDAERANWEDVVALADQCLYAAKASGRDIWVGIVESSAGATMPRHLDVRRALADGTFTLQHSPGRTITWPD